MNQLNLEKGWQMLRLLMWGIPVAVLMGTLGAFFLWALDFVAALRHAHVKFIYCLPLAGIAIYALYARYGASLAAGNQRILEAVEDPEVKVPLRLAPLILLTTLMTHLFGGSAGREGTALQMGGSLAGAWGDSMRLNATERKGLLLAGMAAGFAAVFGTPATGAFFAFEILRTRQFRCDLLLLCLALAFLADWVCHLFPIQHVGYHIEALAQPLFALSGFNALFWVKLLLVALAFGLIARSFIWSGQQIKVTATKWIRPPWLIPVMGGLGVLLICYCLGRLDYLGLGVQSPDPEAVTICSAFQAGGADPLSWFWKALLTIVTLSLGFKGGGVTPLFFIGATLGNSLAVVLGLPIDLLAGLGMVAVFAAATHAPLACCIMSVELFGWESLGYFVAVIYLANYCSGPVNIYQKQRPLTWLDVKLKQWLFY